MTERSPPLLSFRPIILKSWRFFRGRSPDHEKLSYKILDVVGTPTQRGRRLWAAAAVGGAMLFLPPLIFSPLARAEAGANDEVLDSIIVGIVDAEVKVGQYEKALQNLEAARGICEGGACSAEAEARLLAVVGTVQALDDQQGAARKSFEAALKKDADVALPEDIADQDTSALFDEVKGIKTTERAAGCRGRFSGKGRKPVGWKKAEAYFCYREAKQAETEEAFERCAEEARASLEVENRTGTRLVLARCLERSNRWNEAIGEYQEVGRSAPKKSQFDAGRRARTRAADLQRRMPALELKAPKDVEDLAVKLDGTELPLEILEADIPLDPGVHEVVATGTQDGTPVRFSQRLEIEPDETLTLLITLTPGTANPQAQQLLKCLAGGKTPRECLRLPASNDTVSGDLTYRVGVEASGYTDDMDVDVATPSMSFSIENPTDGWGIGAAFLLDVVTAASIDILATASPRWREVRYVPSINGHKKLGDYDVSARASMSREPDYLSVSGGATVTAEYAQKTITPSIGVEYSHDINGRTQTSFDVFGHRINRFAVNLGLGLVLDKATFASISGVAVIEDGDMSKPYRHIPVFSPEVAAAVTPGLVIDAVNFFREPERPLEQLPTSRKRFALAFAIAHRFTDATLRASERLYIDTWGTKASTTDARLMYDVLKELRVWPHLRFHAQTGADFYELAYVVARGPDGNAQVPSLRTGDRELGPLVAVTAGGGVRYEFGERNALGVSLAGDFIYSRFLNHLYLKERLGGFGALGFDAEFE
ncbi:MAG: DUF3570 domain-containing protein [Myxococcota bacterium]